MAKAKIVCEHGKGSSFCKICKSDYDKTYSANSLKEYHDTLSKIGCLFCEFNIPTALHVHHLAKEFKRYGRSQGSVANLQDLESNKAVVLCANCHDLFHGFYGGKNKPFPLLTRDGIIEVIKEARNSK